MLQLIRQASKTNKKAEQMLGFHAPETLQLLLCFLVNFMCIITDMHAAESKASGDYAYR